VTRTAGEISNEHYAPQACQSLQGCRGGTRYDFRKGKGKRTSLPGKPGVCEFMFAYLAAVGDATTSMKAQSRGAPGTFDGLVQHYYASTNYFRMTRLTQRN
jgi:hypothetical protein